MNKQSQGAIQALITNLFGALSNLSPFAKAVSAGATALVSSLVNMAIAGSFNTTSLIVLGCGLLTTAIVYLVPNKSKTAPVK